MPKSKQRRNILQTHAALEPRKKRRRVEEKNEEQPAAAKRSHSTAPRGHSSYPVQCQSVVDRQAAAAVAKLAAADASQRHGATIKSLTLAPHVEAKKATYAVVCQVLKYLPLLQELASKAGLLRALPQLSPYTLYVLTYEMVLGQGLPRPPGPAERAVRPHRQQLKEQLQQLLAAQGVASAQELLAKGSGNDDNNDSAAAAAAAGSSGGNDAGAAVGGAMPQRRRPPPSHPRHARVNTLKLSVPQALALLQHPPAAWPAAAAAAGRLAKQDALLPDVLAFPPGTDLHDHPMVADRSLILQSKASCMPAHALAPRPGWTVVDCCAAPGNKTTHAAALLRGTGRVLAFDKDPKRLARLQTNAEATGAASVITARCADFLTLDPDAAEFADVKGVLLDPSCSGSGTIFSRMDHLLPSHNALAAQLGQQQQQPAPAAAGGSADSRQQQAGGGQPQVAGDGGLGRDEARVAALAKFQQAALRHALRFPGLQRLVYSTCSLHAEENEAVVAAVLPQAQAAGFQLVDPFPGWHRRGLPLLPGAERLVRVDPHEDGTDGFFVAVFQRQTRHSAHV